MGTFVGELRRRNVFRVGIAYVVLGWLVIQITDTVAPALMLPDWTLSLVTWLGVVGFPFALLFAWAFELTPEGIKRSEDVPAEESVTRQTGSRLNQVTLVLMAGVIALLLLDRFYLQQPAVSEGAAPEPLAAGSSSQVLDSIAVLPFVNMSDNRENQYFGDGLAEELLNQLAAIEGLRVAARTSSFYFRDKDPTIAEVAKALDVDTVLEGSVQRSGDTIRVVAQLIRSSDSAHLWSAKYDRPLDDYFNVQDDIANHIIGALMPHIGGQQALVSASGGDISPELFQHFLAARETFHDQTPSAFALAHDAFLDITTSAPDYAPGWAWLARSWLAVSERFGGASTEDASRSNARAAVETALALNPNEARAYFARALLHLRLNDAAAEEADLRHALELDPLLVDARLQLHFLLAFTGRTEEAVAMLKEAQRIDPLHPQLLFNLAHLQNLQGRRRAAFATLERLYRINPVRGAALEAHIYSDSQEIDRRIHFREQYLLQSPEQSDDVPEHNSDAFMYLLMGLYDAPRIDGTEWAPLAAALRGDEPMARQLLTAKPVAPDEDLRPLVQARTYLVLAEVELAQEALWRQWTGPADSQIGPGFNPIQGITLAYILKQQGEEEKLQELLAKIGASLDQMSPLHQGTLQWMQAMYAGLTGETDRALDLLQALAEEGYTGYRMRGTTEAYVDVLPESPRLTAILAHMDANHAASLAELGRLRQSGQSLEQLRQEFVAQLPPDP